MTSAPEAALPGRRRTASSRTGIAMAAEAAAFALASAVHFGTGFTDAAIPELVIAAVLGAGSSAVLTRRPHAWGIAAGTTAFATFGTIVGLTIIAAGRQDVPDLTYHATILAALAGTLTALLRPDGGAGEHSIKPRRQPAHTHSRPGQRQPAAEPPSTDRMTTSSPTSVTRRPQG